MDIAAKRLMISLGQDLKVVLRRLRRTPGTTLMIVATTAVVLGAASVVGIVVLVAVAGPAWRASRVSPAVALRAS